MRETTANWPCTAHFNQVRADPSGEMRAIPRFLDIDTPQERPEAIIEQCARWLATGELGEPQ